jgi:hypothetical protein
MLAVNKFILVFTEDVFSRSYSNQFRWKLNIADICVFACKISCLILYTIKWLRICSLSMCRAEVWWYFTHAFKPPLNFCHKRINYLCNIYSKWHFSMVFIFSLPCLLCKWNLHQWRLLAIEGDSGKQSWTVLLSLWWCCCVSTKSFVSQTIFIFKMFMIYYF